MASAVGPSARRRLPELPADAWAIVARAALHAEDDDGRAWARLSLVNSTWRAALQGVAWDPLKPNPQPVSSLSCTFDPTPLRIPARWDDEVLAGDTMTQASHCKSSAANASA